LFYGTGGLAYRGWKWDGTITFGTSEPFSFNQTQVGWTVGGGIETGVWQNWTARVEYLHLDVGRSADRMDLPNGVSVVVLAGRIQENIIRTALSYHF
jgi:outer membrane immunogenic protein